ncbi:alpha/beta-hydrolase [Aureobasidium subglaciale]|nr:alpha/beta-hydrolase [Aureobasidium subglaciale]
MIAEHDVAVKIRDGCTLYCDIFRPVGSDDSEKLPAIVAWRKKHNGIEMMSKVKWGCGVQKGTLSGLDRFEGLDPAEYCPRGFAIVNVDAKGAGDSDGSIVIMGKESIDELAESFDLFLKGKDNGWEKTSKVRVASLPFGDHEVVYPIEVQDFSVPNTDYKKLYLGEKNNLLESAPTETSIVSYNSESGSHPVAHAPFNLRFDKKPRLMGLPKAVLYMSYDDQDDMVIYVLIRRLDKNGKVMIAINIPWSHCLYPDTASIPESDYSNLMIYFGPTGILRASHRKTDPSKALHPQYPFHTHDEVQKTTPGTVVEFEISLWAAGMDFEEGESLSVQVSGEYPLVDEFKGREPPKAKVEERNKGRHNVRLGGEYASHVILPFV